MNIITKFKNIFKKKSCILQPIHVTYSDAEIIAMVLKNAKIRISDNLFNIRSLDYCGNTLIIGVDYDYPLVNDIPEIFFNTDVPHRLVP